jgi:hypothetical protein
MKKLFLLLIMALCFQQVSWATNFCSDAHMAGGWLLNESSGTAVDCSSQGNNLNNPNNITYSQAGKFGTAFGFTSSPESSININTQPASLDPVLPITMTAWVQTTSTNEMVVETSNGYFDGACGHSGYWMNVTSGKLVCGFGDNAGGIQIDTSTTSVNTGSYVHVACVINGASNMVMYVNGVAESNTYSGSGGSMVYRGSSDHFRLGDSACGARTFIGNLDEVSLFNRVLTSTEINSIMNSGLSPSATTNHGITWFQNR